MSAATISPLPFRPAATVERRLAIIAAVLLLLMLAAFLRHLSAGGAFPRKPWLLLHLSTVLPAVPLGAVVLLRRKGGRTHHLLGRLWGVLMLLAAASGFELGTGWSPIHLLSAITLVGVPRSVWLAMRGEVAAHRRGMLILFASLLTAGFFTLLPARLLGGWLLGR